MWPSCMLMVNIKEDILFTWISEYCMLTMFSLLFSVHASLHVLWWELSDLFWWFCGGCCVVCDLTLHFFLCYVSLFICSKQMLWRHRVSTRFFFCFHFLFFPHFGSSKDVWYTLCKMFMLKHYVLWTKL